MSELLERARQAFMGGIQQFESGCYEAADELFTLALELAPGRPSVLLNLGVTKVRLGRFAEAESVLRSAVAADPTQSDGWVALGLAQMELGQWPAALTSHEHALAAGASSALVHLRLGQCLVRVGRVDEALTALQAAVQKDDGLAEAWTQQGHLWRELQQADQAARCYQRALKLGADEELHRYYLAALQSGELVAAAPLQYVQTLFDQYADEFEGHLVGQLGYQAHQRLVEQLPQECASTFGNVLDLGCGTGLCGVHVRSRARHLTGVDLSAAMLDKARSRKVYDRLCEAELSEYLRVEAAFFDLMLAADVFIYVGALDDVFALLAQRMAPSGWLAFTIEEASAGCPMQLLPSLRYAHGLDYVRQLAARNGLRWVHAYSAPLRYEQEVPISGTYVYLQRA